MVTNFETFRIWFDERFFVLLGEKVAAFSEHSTSEDVAVIARYAIPLSQEGKRFRPFLVFSASGLSIEEADAHFSLFASVELLHLFALIHDDIMDGAQVRHGVLCAHQKFAEQYGSKTAEAIAILLGDIVLAWAYDCLFEYTGQYPETRDALVQEFTQLVSEVTHGQILDVLSPVQPPLSKEAIIQKMTLKTARYSFVQPLRLGMVMRGKEQTFDRFVEKFGVSLGIGFQLQDDLLDVVPKEQSGKSPFVDIETGQQTILSWYMYTEAPIESREAFLSLFRKKLSDKDRETLSAILSESGAIAFTKALAQEYFTKAHEAIQEYVPEEHRPQWMATISLVAERKK